MFQFLLRKGRNDPSNLESANLDSQFDEVQGKSGDSVTKDGKGKSIREWMGTLLLIFTFVLALYKFVYESEIQPSLERARIDLDIDAAVVGSIGTGTANELTLLEVSLSVNNLRKFPIYLLAGWISVSAIDVGQSNVNPDSCKDVPGNTLNKFNRMEICNKYISVATRAAPDGKTLVPNAEVVAIGKIYDFRTQGIWIEGGKVDKRNTIFYIPKKFTSARIEFEARYTKHLPKVIVDFGTDSTGRLVENLKNRDGSQIRDGQGRVVDLTATDRASRDVVDAYLKEEQLYKTFAVSDVPLHRGK